jgi:hypothetical protein
MGKTAAKQVWNVQPLWVTLIDLRTGYCFRVYVIRNIRNMAAHPAHVLGLIDCLMRGARAIRQALQLLGNH